jgi:hypothetical protein
MDSKKPEKEEMNRAARREFKKADEFLQNLVRSYINYKNNHIREDKGYIHLQAEVMIFFDELNQRWRNFCHGYKSNSDRHYKFDVTLFRKEVEKHLDCLLYTSPSPRDRTRSRMPSSA